MQILSPKRRIDILRDVMLAKEKGSPYVITFCGVNGVGKSTNLAKVRDSPCVITFYACEWGSLLTWLRYKGWSLFSVHGKSAKVKGSSCVITFCECVGNGVNRASPLTWPR